MMRTGLTIEDLGDLLELPILAILATHRADGSADAFAASFTAPRLVIRLVPRPDPRVGFPR